MQRTAGASFGYGNRRAARRAPSGARLVCTAGLAMASLGAAATETGGNSYPVGVETNYNGMMLPEGPHFFLYLTHYSSGHFKDDAGKDNPRLAHFHLSADAVALRLSYVWPGVRFLGANVETRVVQAFARCDLDLDIARPPPLAPLDRGGDHAGLADTAFSPVILGWHSPTYHQTVGIDTHLPLGAYDADRRVNTGRNYYQVAPFYAFTWFPTRAVDVNAKFRYAINSRNDDTDYRSGDEATVEFSAGYHVTPRLALGINGYIYRQLTDDKQHGSVVNGNGNRGRANALGPYVSYAFSPKFSVIVKLQQEFAVRNRPQGTRLWAQATIPF